MYYNYSGGLIGYINMLYVMLKVSEIKCTKKDVVVVRKKKH